jgi:hypothetical protein
VETRVKREQERVSRREVLEVLTVLCAKRGERWHKPLLDKCTKGNLETGCRKRALTCFYFVTNL